MKTISDLFFDRFTAVKAGEAISKQLLAQNPPIPVVIERSESGAVILVVPHRWKLILEDCEAGVRFHLTEPEQPGRDGEPGVISGVYQVSFAQLIWKALAEPGQISLWHLRTDAVYEVLRDFEDYYRAPVKAGTRLTFVRQAYLPYESGHTLFFREATIYLQDGQEVCAEFERYFALAQQQG